MFYLRLVYATAACNITGTYSDPCASGSTPTSQYIFTNQVNCRQDAAGNLVLGYRFSCSSFPQCSTNSDCGQDGYCDEYCEQFTAICTSISCNLGGNCAKLATGLNCGQALAN